MATGAFAAVAVPGAGASTTAATQENDSSAYAGTHVAFEASGNAVTDYRVGDEVVFERLAVESQSSHESAAGIGAGASLDAVANLEGAGLSLAAQTETRAEVDIEGSASLAAHDTDRGILTVHAGSESQYAEMSLGSEASASTDGDAVVVESESRSGTFLVVGEGEVTVTDEGTVTASLESESTLVFRSYADGERSDDDREQEALIANGTATAEVYADARDGAFVADIANYGEDIAVETAQESAHRLELTVERAQHEGTVVITSVSETAIENRDDLAVTVDGEAAVEVSSYSELEGAIGSDESRYMVQHASETSASADVLVAVNHFSERTVAMDSSGTENGGDGTGADDGGSDDDSGIGDADETPGFGIVAALAAVLAAGVRLRR
ncbi:hypothetical protein GCM10025298_04990 [Natronobiforma cellulositropha]